MMTRSQQDWHQRYVQQAAWTGQLRQYLYERAGLQPSSPVLEVGCGTGAVLAGLSANYQAYGLDIQRLALEVAEEYAPGVPLVEGDGRALPFHDRSFSAVVCHFFLLWVPDPVRALAEMRRVTQPGGSVLALAEPDYGGRVDYPEELALLGRLQRDALEQQGASPDLGRRLAALLKGAGLKRIEVGVLGGQWRTEQQDWDGWKTEWEVLRADLGNALPEEKLDRLQELDQNAWQAGKRILYVPTFYGYGIVDE